MEFTQDNWTLHMELNPMLRSLIVTLEDAKGEEVTSFIIPPSLLEPMLTNWVKTIHPHVVMTKEEMHRMIENAYDYFR